VNEKTIGFNREKTRTLSEEKKNENKRKCVAGHSSRWNQVIQTFSFSIMYMDGADTTA
jgi:hypothetical protein